MRREAIHKQGAMTAQSETPTHNAAGSAGEVFGAFLKLGLTSFGGPIAHLGYFREELVLRRRWIDEAGYADLVALCQFLPGPASSQVGFALGLMRGGALGALAAWCAFTLPSATLLLLFAVAQTSLTGPVAAGAIDGLKLVAVAIVAQAVWGMAKSLCPDRERASIALVAVLIVTFVGGGIGQIGAIVVGGLIGLWLCRAEGSPAAQALRVPVSRRAGATMLACFFVLLVGAPLAVASLDLQALALFDVFYRAGALVFGGGHVVLPLLEAGVVPPGWVSESDFLAGYGAAQAVPGPLFTFGAYLGAMMGPEPNGFGGALISLVAIFLPGLLLVAGALPFWDQVRVQPQAQSAMRGTNAAVVGVLGAALYDPVWTSAVIEPSDFALALIGFILLTVWKTPPLAVVALMVAASTGVALL